MIKENQTLLNRINALSDILILFISISLAYFIRFFILNPAPGVAYIDLHKYLQFTLIIIPINIIIYYFLHLYDSFRTKSFSKELSNIVKANTILIVALLSILFTVKLVHLSRLVLVIFYFINIALISVKRYTLRKVLWNIRSKGLNLKHVIIIGSGQTAKEYLNIIKNNKEYGYNYVGYVSNNLDFDGENLDVEDAKYLEDIVSACEKSGTKISIVPFCYKYIPSQPYIDVIGHMPLINIRRIPLDNLGNAFLKRTLDIFGSLFLILITSPIMLFTAIAIKLTSPGPVIFKQTRVGLNKNPFVMYKFRSMRINSESNTAWSTNVDHRKTKFGSFIRKFSIDELPQFFNVLKGDMSLVGPRPELPHFVDTFKDEIPLYMVKHQVKPGITGLAQVNGYRGDTSIKKRIEYDIYYIENWSIFMEISILFKTVFKGIKNNEKLELKHKEISQNKTIKR